MKNDAVSLSAILSYRTMSLTFLHKNNLNLNNSKHWTAFRLSLVGGTTFFVCLFKNKNYSVTEGCRCCSSTSYCSSQEPLAELGV